MSNRNLRTFLQLFADGGAGGAAPAGDGGAGGDAATGVIGTENSDANDDVPASIPEKARSIYRKAMKQHRANTARVPAESSTTAEEKATDAPSETAKEESPPEQKRPTYAELIKSPEYKEEHSRYMQQAIAERFKGVNARTARTDKILSVVATKYGLDPQSESFLEDLEKATNADDAYYEAYAEKHDMTSEEARRVVNLEQQLAAAQREEARRREAEEDARAIEALRPRAAETQKRYPSFDLDTEMKNPAFVRILNATQGDTTAAYMAVHHGELIPQMIQRATDDAVRATVNDVRRNAARPAENGVSSPAPAAKAEVDYSKMNLAQIRAQAAAWRNGKG